MNKFIEFVEGKTNKLDVNSIVQQSNETKNQPHIFGLMDGVEQSNDISNCKKITG